MVLACRMLEIYSLITGSVGDGVDEDFGVKKIQY
jgi:hypothetical protein